MWNIFQQEVRKSWLKKMIKKIAILKKKHNIKKEYISFEREMVARALFVGFFIAFIPMPMQMFAVFLVSPFMRFNVPIAFIICWITNPFTMPFVYYTEYNIGLYLLGMEVEKLSFTLEEIYAVLTPLYYGAFVLSITTATTSYYLLKFFWKEKN